MVTIDVREVVESQLSYTLDTAQEIYSQNTIFADFTATIDGTSHSFLSLIHISDPVRDSGSGRHAGKLVEVPLPHVAAKGQGGDLLLTGVVDLLRHIGLHGEGQGHVPGQLVEHDLLEGNDRRRVRDTQSPIRDRSQAIREQVPQLSRGLRRGRRSETERIAIL